MQECLQRFHISFDVDWNHLCFRCSDSWMLGYVLRTSLLSTGMWEHFCFLVSHLWWALLWASPSAASSCNCLPLQSLLCHMWLPNPCWPKASFRLDLSEYMEPAASHRRVLVWHKSLLKPLCVLPKTLFFKSKMRKKEKEEETEKNREGERERTFSPANVEQNSLSSLQPQCETTGVTH